MKITLKIEGKDVEFRQEFISGRMFRRTLEVQKLFKENEHGKTTIDENSVDALVDYVCDLYGKQFTRDQFYDGIDARQMISTIMTSINAVVSGASEAVGADTSDPN